ncbi:MAG: hypothetical protein PVI26_05205 [Chitinispirillia bacterium]|jgi:hypothetical protein
MEKVKCTRLRPGSIARGNYYSHKGELLIGVGVLITFRIIKLLKKRENYVLFFDNSHK